jgi:hypothetical protein
MEQMNDVWGLSPEVIEKLNQHFKVKTSTQYQKNKYQYRYNKRINAISLF